MRLSLDVISEQLSATCTNTSIQLGDAPSALYGFPSLYQPGDSFQGGHLYVADADELPKGLWLRSSIGLIVCGNAPEAYALQGCSILCVEKEVTKANLFAFVSEIYWKFQKWETKLHKLLSTHTLLQKYLEITYPLIQSPLWICGKSGKPLAHFEEDIHGDYDISTAFSGRITPLDQILQNADFYTKWQSDQKTFETETHAEGKVWPCYYRSLYNDQGDYLGFLMLVSYTSPIRKSDKLIINYLGNILEQSLDRMVELRGRQLWGGTFLFKDILEGTHLSQVEFNQRLSEQGLLDHRFCCVRLILKQLSLSLPVETICWHINSGMKDVYAMVYDASIVLFIRLSVDTYSLRELPDYVDSFVKRGDFCVGVSHTFSSVRDAKHYYLQACKALELGVRHDPDNYCYFFSDYALRYILEQNLAIQPARTLCMEGIKMLQDMDRNNESEYCRTLKVYFENGMNLQKTADELYIHRSTLTYRLNRIRKDAGIDLDDYRSRLYAMLSLELLEG